MKGTMVVVRSHRVELAIRAFIWQGAPSKLRAGMDFVRPHMPAWGELKAERHSR